MGKWLMLLSFFMACSTKEDTQNPVVYEEPKNDKWIVYEGVVRSIAGNDVKIQLSLLQNSVDMESEYRTEEEYTDTNERTFFRRQRGKYSILYGSGTDILITLHESFRHPAEQISAETDLGKLSFRSGRNSNELILLDENASPVSQDERYTLKSRSIIFTVEGFVTISPTGSDFFEFNTQENWKVIKRGSYSAVVNGYIEKSREKNEGIYLKGVAYYVEDIDSAGADVKNLVIKRIISMKSHQEFMAMSKAIH